MQKTVHNKWPRLDGRLFMGVFEANGTACHEGAYEVSPAGTNPEIKGNFEEAYQIPKNR